MRPEDATEGRLWDMLAAAREVAFFVAGRARDDYDRDVMLRRAGERSVEIIGEAARRIPEAIRSEHPTIPWQGIVGQRHRLAHEYGDISADLIWRVATVHVPVLITALEPLVIEPTPSPGRPPPSPDP